MINKNIKYSIHSITAEEAPYLKEYSYKALFVPTGEKPFPKSIVDDEVFIPIYSDWGKHGDTGLWAKDDVTDQLIGMAWVRIYNKENLPFGILDTKIPALSIAVDDNYQKSGIGSALLINLIDEVKEKGFEAISLSVDHRNYAVKLYKKVGFELFKEGEEFNPLYLLKF